MTFFHDLLKKYSERFPDEMHRLAPLLQQLSGDSKITSRSTSPGHITASAVVLHAGKILMIFHPFLQKWLQPGGHLEAKETPQGAAQRELLEETGFSAHLHSWHKKNQHPFDIDIHSIPANIKKREPEHLHYDFRYLFSIDEEGVKKPNCDHEWRWIELQEAHEITHLVEKINILFLGS